MMEDNKLFQVEITCPDHVFFTGQASMIEFCTTEGEVGIYKDHVPTTMVLKPGVVQITMPEEKKEAALHGGFVQVLGEQITILAEAAEWPEEIDVSRAQKAKERAEKRLSEKSSDLDVLRAETALYRAVARLSAAKKR